MSAFDGSGTFVISGTGLPVVTNTVISSTVANTLNADLAIGLSTCITKNGQTTVTANIPMAGYKVTGVGSASSTGDVLSRGRAASVTTLATSGNVSIAGTCTVTGGDLSCTNGDIHSGNSVTATNFGQLATLTGLALTLSAGSVQFDVIPGTNGVRLTDGATSWSAISERAKKKDIQPLPSQPLDVISAHDVKLGRYVSDAADAPLSPFLFYEDAVAHFPYATVYTPERQLTDPKTGKTMMQPEYKGICLEKYVPLLMAAFHQQVAINADLTARIGALEGKK